MSKITNFIKVYPENENRRFEVHTDDQKTFEYIVVDTDSKIQQCITESFAAAIEISNALTAQHSTLGLVQREIDRAKAKHGPQKFNSFHEGYAVLLEEVDEVKAEVWKSKHDKELIKKEAIQVAAMAVRIVDELCK